MLSSLTAFSQENRSEVIDTTFKVRAIKLGKDTCIVYSVKQSKFLEKQYYRAIALDTLNSTCQKQLVDLKTLIENNKTVHNNDLLIIKNQQEITELYKFDNEQLTKQVKQANKEIKKQKVIKWTFGAVAVGLGGYIFVNSLSN